jgi:hypothetical protein
VSNPYFGLAQRAFDASAQQTAEREEQRKQSLAILPAVQANGPVAIRYIHEWAATQDITQEQLDRWHAEARPVSVAVFALPAFWLGLDGSVNPLLPYTNENPPPMDENSPQEFLNNAVQALAESLAQTL